ncbi:MAG: DUF370 domain-containing protein [Candidatus Eremiobacteraeota bacterium]|jgi:regulator of extracellular matrix RemA (YlzA/DUF370 family)|nr:DUF370 domain-containing protein [Candidatus Eremiobacteraeota bacterium]MCL5055187.1 DUF370 domain-containing protein [Bacillota bacterium]
MKQTKRKNDHPNHFSDHPLLLNVGYGNFISVNKLVAVLNADSSPIKRVVQEAKDKGILVDATYGRRTRSVLIMDSGHVVLSAIQSETMSHRFLNSNYKEPLESQTEVQEEKLELTTKS